MSSQFRSYKYRSRKSGDLRPPLASRPRGAGFTLVEMMVSVTLVVIMMLMFARVFELAAGSVTVQRGLAENSQRARTVTTVLRGDLDKRTFRRMIPIAPPPDENHPEALPWATERRGYFYISENDPNDDTDDVLQFTIESSQLHKNKDPLPYFGRAVNLGNINVDTNQPAWDDGQGGNGASSSEHAEVTYFLRNGILFRRVHLIREPRLPGGTGPTDPMPRDTNDNRLIVGDYTQSPSIWNDFSFSIYYHADPPMPDPNDPAGPRFHGVDSLENTGEVGLRPGHDDFSSLGNPKMRFGHNHADGQPFEFVLEDVGGQPVRKFIGRYTQEETSHSNFGYPGRIPSSGNPMDRTIQRAVVNGVVAQSPGGPLWSGPRRSEDVLLTNVHSFDVKVWDDHPQVQDFVDIGHERTAGGVPVGHYHRLNNQLPAYGPRIHPPGIPPDQSENRVYDTWHRYVELGLNGSGGFDPPPYRPVGSDGVTPIPLKAIQITIRFLDIPSDQMRQLTIVHSLVD